LEITVLKLIAIFGTIFYPLLFPYLYDHFLSELSKFEVCEYLYRYYIIRLYETVSDPSRASLNVLIIVSYCPVLLLAFMYFNIINQVSHGFCFTYCDGVLSCLQ